MRNIERSHFASSREVAAMVFNTSVKKGKQKRASKLYPLSIDLISEFTYEDAVNQYERMSKAGWLDRLN